MIILLSKTAFPRPKATYLVDRQFVESYAVQRKRLYLRSGLKEEYMIYFHDVGGRGRYVTPIKGLYLLHDTGRGELPRSIRSRFPMTATVRKNAPQRRRRWRLEF